MFDYARLSQLIVVALILNYGLVFSQKSATNPPSLVESAQEPIKYMGETQSDDKF